MIDSLHNVDLNFYEVFLGEGMHNNTIQVQTHKGKTLEVPARFAKKSAVDISETDTEVYPVIAIMNYSPKLKENYHFPYQDRFAALRDSNADSINDTVTQYFDPIPLVFKYDISVAARAESDWDAIKKYFYSLLAFDKQKNFLFNKKDLPLNDHLQTITSVGDPVKYEWETNDPVRSDGVFETIFSFQLLAWVHIKEPKDFDVLEQIGLNFNVQ